MIALSPLHYDFLLSSYTTSFLNFQMAHLYRSRTRDSSTELSASQVTSGHGSLSYRYNEKSDTYIYFGTHITGQKNYPESKWQKNPVESSAPRIFPYLINTAVF